jgi:uncharacterized protein YecE (DUF72 family)
LPAVEINYTFRRMPKASTFEGWADKTPLEFRFALKAPQKITHFSRLRHTKESLDYFLSVTTALGSRLGPVLFQLPPDLPRDDALLADFLNEMGDRVLAAFEFRNRSWFNDRVFDILRANKAALCIAESEKLTSPIECTASHAYLRLRNESYDDSSLAVWAGRIRNLGHDADEMYVFFKHESSAPDLALRLCAMIEGFRPI